MKMIDLTGKQFGSLEVLSFSHSQKSHAMWLCRCVCGEEKPVLGKHLRSGRVVSCGCMRGPKVQYEDYSVRRAELKEANPEISRAARQRYLNRHADRVKVLNRINSSLTRARRKQLNSCPDWADKQAINVVYEKAKEYGFDVDHIVPIASKHVCGLHVWHNLQLLHPSINKTKSNRFWPDMADPTRLPNATLVTLTS